MTERQRDRENEQIKASQSVEIDCFKIYGRGITSNVNNKIGPTTSIQNLLIDK